MTLFPRHRPTSLALSRSLKWKLGGSSPCLARCPFFTSSSLFSACLVVPPFDASGFLRGPPSGPRLWLPDLSRLVAHPPLRAPSSPPCDLFFLFSTSVHVGCCCHFRLPLFPGSPASCLSPVWALSAPLSTFYSATSYSQLALLFACLARGGLIVASTREARR